MEGNEQLAVIVPMLKDVANGISEHQLGDPTPCASFTVADVLDHMTGLASSFAPMFRGEAPSEEGVPSSAVADGTAPFLRAMDGLLDAVQSPGALARTVDSPFGPMPGAVFARLVAFDGLVHGWDLATSTGQEWQPSDGLVAEVDGFARQAITPEMRDGDAFAAEQEPPEGAGPMRRLVAFTGRVR